MKCGLRGVAVLLVCAALCAGRPGFADDEDNSHAGTQTNDSTPAKDGPQALSTTLSQPLLVRQEALVNGLKAIGLETFPLERLGRIVANNPRATPEQFNRIVDLAAQAMQGLISDEQKAKVKKLYADELGSVKEQPGAEFASAAKLLIAAKSKPDGTTPKPSGSNPTAQNGSAKLQSSADQLQGQTTIVRPPGAGLPAQGQEQLLNALFDKIAKAQGGNPQAQFQAQLAQAQALLASMQKAAQGDNRATFSRLGGTAGLLDSLLSQLRKGEKEEKEGGGDRDRRSDFGRFDRGTHGNDSADTSSDDTGNNNKGVSLDDAKKRFADNNNQNSSGRTIINNGSGFGNGSNNNSGSSSSTGKDDKQDGKQGKEIIQAGDISKKLRDDDEANAKKKADKNKLDLEKLKSEFAGKAAPGTDDDLLAAAKASGGARRGALEARAEGKPGQPIAGGRGGFGGFGDGEGGGGGGKGGGGGGGGGKGGAAKIAQGAGGGGGGGEGNPFVFNDGNENYYGGPYTFDRQVEFGNSNGGVGGPTGEETVDGGPVEDDLPNAGLKGKAAMSNGQVIFLTPGDGKLGSIMDFVGHWAKKACGLENAKDIGWCEDILARRQGKESGHKLSIGEPAWLAQAKAVLEGGGSSAPSLDVRN